MIAVGNGPVLLYHEMAFLDEEGTLDELRAKMTTPLIPVRVPVEAVSMEDAVASYLFNSQLLSNPDGTMTLSAPISGRVAHVGAVTGGPVNGMEAPFVIEAEGAYQVELQLPERLARKVRPGMPVEIALSTDGGGSVPVGGRILAVSPSIDPATRSVLARASMGSAPGIVAGRNVSVTIIGKASPSGIAVPANAVTKMVPELGRGIC